MNQLKSYSFIEAEDLLVSIFETNMIHNKDRITVNLIGERGIGKSQFIKEFANTIDADYVKITLTNYDETTALLGFPRKTYRLQKGDKTINVEYESVQKLVAQGFSLLSVEPEMTYANPDWVQKLLKSKKSVLHIDEYNRAFPHIKQAVMELINAGEYGNFTLPVNCQIILSSNPNTGDYNIVSDDDEAHKDRYFHLPIRLDILAWAKWAINDGIDSKFVEYLIKNPEVIQPLEKTEINPSSVRMWTRFFRSIDRYTDLTSTINFNMVYNLGSISVGETYVLHFIEFMKNNLNSIPSMEKVFDVSLKPNVVLEELRNSVTDNSTGDERDDIKAIVGFKINNYLLNYPKSINTAFMERIKFLLLSDIINADSILQIVHNIIKTSEGKAGNDNLTKIKKYLTSDLELQTLLMS